MRIVDELRRQHRLIDAVAGSLHHWAKRGAGHPDAAADKADLIRFFQVFVVEHHHHDEELLFEALVEHAETPDHRGPIAVLRHEHEALADAVRRFEAASDETSAADLARQIAAELWQHLDKEESVLLPEVERRLIDGGVRELDPSPLTDRVRSAEERGRETVKRLPPVDDPELIRGDGCIPCPAFGSTCHGIETEWWSDWERDHHAALDEG